jgi:hypothetical protein
LERISCGFLPCKRHGWLLLVPAMSIGFHEKWPEVRKWHGSEPQIVLLVVTFAPPWRWKSSVGNNVARFGAMVATESLPVAGGLQLFFQPISTCFLFHIPLGSHQPSDTLTTN